jgi:phosphatidylglycerol:prolipoprotein diacylglycerol transferase
MIILGIVAGLGLAYRLAAPKGQAYQEMLIDLGLWLVVAGIVGARAWEIIFTWSDYSATPWDRLAIWKGGMSIQGAMLGGLIAALIFAWRRNVRAWDLLDILAPGMLLGQAFGRIGCTLSGDSFSRPVSEVPWWPQWFGFVYAPESPAYQVMGAVKLVPAEFIEMLVDFLLVAVLLLYKPKRSVPGRVVLMYGILYSMARFGLESLRADSLMVANFKVAQVLSLAVVLVASLLLVSRYRQAEVTIDIKG